ncbi:uncharacterized protein A4U43_C05F25340 [Asparagus officinalis]|uniref:Uncharacterized protein n=1 Tax=Asparagus officinalis TaxID=4686 RepID=A0A5P1EUD9_ASPOF|nr:uncharacterized protein A4U43_C05F25340 [Asparagus officinalis]
MITGKKWKKNKDDRAYMDIEVEELTLYCDICSSPVIATLFLRYVKITEEVTEKKKRKTRRKETYETLKEFVHGLQAKSQRTTRKLKFLESLFQTVILKKRSKGKKSLIMVEDDDDKREKEEDKELAIAYADTRTSVEDLWIREKNWRRK